MKRIVDDERLMVRVSELYYNQGYGHKEIGDQLGLSRPTVSRLITNAREHGIVRIIIADVDGRNHMELEQQLEAKFGLKAAVITDSYSESTVQKQELGRAAAKYLERILQNGNTVGVSMGSTLSYIAPYITADFFTRIRVVPMVGGVGKANMSWHSNSLSEALARALGGESLALHAPAMVSRLQTKAELLREESIASVLNIASKLDVALNGIGAPDEASTVIATGYFDKRMMNDFDKYNICGDISMNFYDKNGNLSLYEHNNRVIGVSIHTLRNTQWSIGIAGDLRKADAIRGALAGKYINVLITDRDCAQTLIEH